MKRKLFFLFLIFQLAAAFAFAGLHVSESSFASSQINSSQDSPQIALRPRTGQALVVWQRSENGLPWETRILGRIVNAKGKAVSGELKLAAGIVSGYGGGPSVTYNPLLNEFLVAYDAESGISVRRIAANGKPSGKSINITTDPISANSPNYSPRVIFNPTTEGYTVLWTREDSSGSVIVGLSLTKAGKVDGSVQEIHTACCGGSTLDLEYLPLGKKVVAVFFAFSSHANVAYLTANYYLATFDPTLTNVHVSKINIKSADREIYKFWWAASLAVLPDSSAMVFYSDDASVKGRKITPDGKLNGSPFVAFQTPENKTRLLEPSAVFSSTSNGTRGLLIATEDNDPEGTANSWAQVLDDDGKSIGAPILLNSTSGTETTRAGQISVLPVGATSKSFQFQYYQTLGPTGDFPQNQIGPAGTRIQKFKISLAEP